MSVSTAKVPAFRGAPSPQLPATRQILKDVFGYDAFRPGQEQVINALLEGHNVLAVMPTGSGKSLCFQVPALVLGGLTIVVSPLIALMQDQVQSLRLAGVAADAINSSQSREDNVAAWQRAASGVTRLLYLSPERFMTERMLSALGKLDVKLIAIDEAHCISQWGPAFRPEYQALSQLVETFPGVPIAALTATADEVTRSDISAQLFNNRARSFVLGFDRPNITLTVEPKREWKQQMLAFVKRHAKQSGIVYCLSRKRTEEAAAALKANGVRALAYHAGMTKEMREANQNVFMTEPSTVMAATIAFGMGIDKPDVRFVFHADLPGSPEAYYQEFGRAGRDGAPAQAHMLFGLGDIRMRRMFIDQEDAGEDRRRREHQRLGALLGYCEAPGCRRQALLSYFGEKSSPCGNCDNCLNPSLQVDATVDAKLVFRAIRETGERFGAVQIADVLSGTLNDKVTERGHDRLGVFGLGAHRRKEDWQTLLRQLVAGGYLTLDIGGYGGVMLGDPALEIERGNTRFHHRPAEKRKKAGREDKVRSSVPATVGEGSEDLLQTLKQVRLQLAKERQVPAYLIFPDRSLIDMAERKPETEDDFSQVIGVGAAKLKLFASTFLDAIRDHARRREAG